MTTKAYEYRVVQSIGAAYNPTRRIHKTGNRGFSLSTVIPSTMAKALSLKAGHILRFSIEAKKLIVEKVQLD
jgi:antitoxin component of MazEF toxin-antitoxin module